jgi:hypothetical protein
MFITNESGEDDMVSKRISMAYGAVNVKEELSLVLKTYLGRTVICCKCAYAQKFRPELILASVHRY